MRLRGDHAQTNKHDPEKWMPGFGCDKRKVRLRGDHAQTNKHDPEKWMPGFGYDKRKVRLRGDHAQDNRDGRESGRRFSDEAMRQLKNA
jgi:hypothetical protein